MENPDIVGRVVSNLTLNDWTRFQNSRVSTERPLAVAFYQVTVWVELLYHLTTAEGTLYSVEVVVD